MLAALLLFALPTRMVFLLTAMGFLLLLPLLLLPGLFCAAAGLFFLARARRTPGLRLALRLPTGFLLLLPLPLLPAGLFSSCPRLPGVLLALLLLLTVRVFLNAAVLPDHLC